MTYLHHVTVDTGHVRHAHLTDVPAPVRDALTPVIRAAIEGGRHPIPGLERFAVSIDAGGRASMTATLWRGDQALVTFAVCRKSRAGPGAWRAIVPDDLRGVLNATPPPAPWLAVRFEPGLALLPPDDVMLMANVELAVAVAWLGLRDDA
ncbi:hypothetical protein [uncultured Brevundimonas sp.]|uniref:hypothetical protein n=1 Tax=uncultured Brevundimonas sp. TaxID=213418 RepID=UPI002610CE4C|nr:hypothetical protein [uncultured Brevundimonas sp.]